MKTILGHDLEISSKQQICAMPSINGAAAHAGNSKLADEILSNDFHEIAPIFGTEIKGRDKFKSTIDGLFSVR